MPAATGPMQLTILAEGRGWLCIDKPAGTPTIADRFGSDSVHAQLQAQIGARAWVAHRLDREVTGLLVFATDADSHRRLSMAFEQRQVTKTYEAWCRGVAPAWQTHRWHDRLLRGKKRSYVHALGKEAITDAQFCGHAAAGDGLRFLLHPQTGRNHQLRVHLANAGWPIDGDRLYGSAVDFADGAIALRAVAARFAAGVLAAEAVELRAPDLSAWKSAR